MKHWVKSQGTYLLFASFFLGTFVFQTFFCVYVLVRLISWRGVINQNSLRDEAQLTAAMFFGLILINAIHHQLARPELSFDFHWGFLGIWAIWEARARRLCWGRLHNFMLIASLPGLLFSVYWLCRPSEIVWAQTAGFAGYPRAYGFLSNPIPYGEGMMILFCWSLARLNLDLSPRLRNWMLAHMGLTLAVILVSRIRSGLLVAAILIFVHGLLHMRQRFKAIAVVLGLGFAIVPIFLFFGFNQASMGERYQLMSRGLELIAANPLWGIGPDHFDEVTVVGYPLAKHPHNSLIGLTAELGFPGLICYLVFVGTLARRLLQGQLKDWDWKRKSAAYVFIWFLAYNLLDFNFGNSLLLLMYSLHWGLSLRVLDPLAQTAKAQDETVMANSNI